MKNRGIFILFAVLFLCRALVCGVSAEESGALPKEYSSMVDELPNEVSDYLPEGIYSDDAESVGDAVAQMTSAEFLLSLIGELTGARIGSAASLLASIVGIIVLSALFSAFKSSVASEAISRTVGFCSSCALFAVIISEQIRDLEAVEAFFQRISTLIYGMIPATGVIYAMGGNVTTAVSNSGTLYLFLAFCETFCAGSVIPVASVLTTFSLCGTLSPSLHLSPLSSALKKCYTVSLGFIMSILLFVLSLQTVLSSSADTISARAAKLVATSVIPLVGGSVGETLRTVSSSVGYIKNVCGISGILFIVILLLPILISLLLTRLVFILTAALADMLGCETEGRVLGEVGGVYGTLLAVVSMVAVMFIFALTIFTQCAVAAA